jgi:hypothetical protein
LIAGGLLIIAGTVISEVKIVKADLS